MADTLTLRQAIEAEATDDDRRIVRCLVRSLARLVDGRTPSQLHGAFGAPGDWGYYTRIGAALWELYSAAAPEPAAATAAEADRLRDALSAMASERDAADLMRVEAQSRMRDCAMALRDVAPGPHAGPKDAEDYLAEVGAEIDRMRARIAELEAPPVVPYPYEVIELDGRWRLYEHQCSETDPLPRLGQDGAGVCAEDDMGDASVATEAVLGLIYAIKTGKRPPHEKHKKYVSSEKLTADECVYARGDKSSGWCVTEDGRGYVRHDWYERAVRSRPMQGGGERG